MVIVVLEYRNYLLMNTHSLRIKRLLKILKSDYPGSAFVVTSNPQIIESRDRHFPYRVNSELFYLTGLMNRDLALIIRPGSKSETLLLSQKVDLHTKIWEGTGPSVAASARSLGLDYRVTPDLRAETKRLLRGCSQMFFQSQPAGLSNELAKELIGASAVSRFGYPHTYTDTDEILDLMRLIKDKEELSAIVQASKVSAESLNKIKHLFRPGVYEYEIANALRAELLLHNADIAFDTIVGSGASAATLHYNALNKRLKKGEMLLIDFGAKLNSYAADITRVFPIGGGFSAQQAEIYEIVLEAQLAAIKALRPGRAISEIYDSAVKILIRGLLSLRVLTGTLAQNIKSKNYKLYFPHGIGHSLGLDIHDENRIRSVGGPKLAAGMVITIEPGLYFRKKIAGINPCGVRIEDNLLITSTGSRNLTADLLPKERAEIELLH